MAWLWEVIHKEWLLGESIGVSREDVVAAFDAAERMLGADWVEQQRHSSIGVVAGVAPTLAVVATGRALALIEGRPGAQQLGDRLATGDRAAFAELQAIYLCSVGLGVEIEIEADLRVSERNRKPDFRLRHGDSPWTHTEVAAPDMSETRKQAEAVMNELASINPILPDNTAVDLILRRDVTRSEVGSLRLEMIRLGTNGVAGNHDFGCGVISVNMSHPSMFERREIGDEPYPGLRLDRIDGQVGGPAKRVSVRYPYSDERAEMFLRRESKQLSRKEPGLVMLSLSSVPGSFKTWRPLLMRRLQPSLHRRVSAICLFTAGMETTAAGEDVVSHTSTIENPHALNPLPSWLIGSVKRFEAA